MITFEGNEQGPRCLPLVYGLYVMWTGLWRSIRRRLPKLTWFCLVMGAIVIAGVDRLGNRVLHIIAFLFGGRWSGPLATDFRSKRRTCALAYDCRLIDTGGVIFASAEHQPQ